MAKGQIQYTIQSGNFPVGVTMEPNSGKLLGNLSPENLDQGPIWNSPAGDSILSSVGVGDTVNITSISVSPRPGKQVLGVAVVGQKPLPWGLKMNPATGAITGKVAELKGEQLAQVANTNPPIWTTQFGSLGGFGETTAVNLTLAATPQLAKTHRSYSVIAGGLPWGLSLDPRTGRLTGTTQEIRDPGFDLGISPSANLPPLWTTLPGTLVVFNENDTVSVAANNAITFKATAQSGKTVSTYRVISGALPWGLGLDPRTGVITGTCSEVKLVTDPVFYDRTKDPVLSNTLTVNGQTLNLMVDGGSLGSFAKGTAVTAQLTATPYAGRTARCHIANGSLPIGLKMDSTGKITGTIAATKYVASGIYNFTVRVVDNVQAYSLRAYSLTVQ